MSQLVTVYIPTCNRLHLLKRAADSVLNQSYKNIELIIVDDNSSDGTKDYLAELVKKDHRVTYIINALNMGASASRNSAIEAASGEFITGLDDDDYFLKYRVEAFLDAWQVKNATTIALYTSVTKKIGDQDFILDKKIPIVSQTDLLYSNYMGNQVFLPTHLLRKVDGFDVELPAWQDLDCWYRLLTMGRAERVDNESYALDVSHALERISKGALQKVDESFDVFCEKYHLGYRDSARLACQKTWYSPSVAKYIQNCLLAVLIIDFRLLRMSLVRMKKFLQGRIYR